MSLDKKVDEIEIEDGRIIDDVIQQDEDGEIIGFTIQEIEDDISTETIDNDPKMVYVYKTLQRQEEEHFCEVCNESFNNIETLITHRSIHEETVLCEKCNVKIIKKSLQFHMAVEHPERPSFKLLFYSPTEPQQPVLRVVNHFANKRKVIKMPITTDRSIKMARKESIFPHNYHHHPVKIKNPKSTVNEAGIKQEAEVQYTEENEHKQSYNNIQEGFEVTQESTSNDNQSVQLKINEIHENFQENEATNRKIIIENPRSIIIAQDISSRNPNLQFLDINLRKKLTHDNLRRVLAIKKQLTAAKASGKGTPIQINDGKKKSNQNYLVKKQSTLPVQEPIAESESEGASSSKEIEVYMNKDSLGEVKIKTDYPVKKNIAPMLPQRKIETRNILPTKDFEYTCANCGKVFSNPQALKIHQSLHEDKTSCEICGIKINSRAISIHMSVMHKKNSKNTKKLTTIFPHTYEKENPFKCGICGNRFALKIILERHMSTHDERKRCRHCGKNFAKKDFDIHMQQHTNKLEKFCCSVCKARFTTEKYLEEHRKTHGIKIVYSVDRK